MLQPALTVWHAEHIKRRNIEETVSYYRYDSVCAIFLSWILYHSNIFKCYYPANTAKLFDLTDAVHIFDLTDAVFLGKELRTCRFCKPCMNTELRKKDRMLTFACVCTGTGLLSWFFSSFVSLHACLAWHMVSTEKCVATLNKICKWNPALPRLEECCNLLSSSQQALV